MAARKKADAICSRFAPAEFVQPTVVEESAQVVVVETKKDVKRPITEELLISEDRGKKRSAEDKGSPEDGPVDKRPCLEESAVVAHFIIEPKIKNMPISSEASALKDLAVALSLAAAVSLLADMATFRAEPDLATVALAAQSTFLVIVYPWNMMIFWFAFDVSWNETILCFVDNWKDRQIRPTPAEFEAFAKLDNWKDWPFAIGS